MNAQHLANDGDWESCDEFALLARRQMGRIDLDPASTPQANKRIGAKRIITAAQDGLTTSWAFGTTSRYPRALRVFLNPPGHCGWKVSAARGRRTAVCDNEKKCSCGLVAQFWTLAMENYYHGVIEELFWVGFSVNQLRTLQATPYGGPLANGSVCIPAERFPYVDPRGEDKNHPSHDSFLCYVGPKNFRLARSLGELVG